MTRSVELAQLAGIILADDTSVTFTPTGMRIKGDFSNGTLANRMLFQNSAANSQTSIGVIPSGTATNTSLILFAGSAPDNSTIGFVQQTESIFAVSSSKSGTGSYTPMAFYTGGTERIRIDTSGNLGLGTDTPYARLDVAGTSGVTSRISNMADSLRGGKFVVTGAAGSGTFFVTSTSNGYALTFGIDNIEKARIDVDGSFKMTGGAGMGYGTGSGGTVTQATSKATGVTLNKPVGRITMAATALAAATTAEFTFSNSLLAAEDMLVMSIIGGAATAAAYHIGTRSFTTGSCVIGVRNITGASLSEAIQINFAIIKGATA